MDYPEKKKQAWANASDKLGASWLDATAAVPAPAHGDCWGNWELDAERLLLVYRGAGLHKYEIPIREMNSSAEMLDWIFQLNSKTWITRKDIGDLVEALDDLFRPQANLCSGGQDHEIDAANFLRELVEHPSRQVS